MEEPHQRTQSGKLRKTFKQIGYKDTAKTFERKVVYTGIENATKLSDMDSDEEYTTYLQTPYTLSDFHVLLLKEIASGYGIVNETSIDRYWRRTWNIGAWHIDNKLSISINLKQPNIANCWANITKVELQAVEKLAAHYSSYRLPKSTCKVSGTDIKVQVQGRWTPNIVDRVLKDNLTSRENIEISSLNIGQTRLFCWLFLNTGSRYVCFLTKGSIDIIVKYIPNWCMDMSETSSGGSTTLKLRNPPIINDSTQLSITELGWIQYQGRSENIKELSKALSIAIDSTIQSLYLRPFLDSLEYKILAVD